ncbi:MAG: tryptophan--tRNA ligase [Gemmatimonadaceae bacterium]|jgi:tryptophanyl-tRNA synthetase|nr:tryptophan--tRNA ligase [Gemmatimonadaceae bacterium]
MSRVFSGIQPSGELHIGNYLGAVKNWADIQHRHPSFFCVVDYHAITVAYEPAQLRARTRDLARTLFAAGLDPAVCHVFVQSTVPEHTELQWIFNTVTPLGELERQTQFKDKSQKQEQVMAGLLNYPVLQAADILLYRADVIPVGEDQVQHLELSRVIARNWNARFGEFFPEPKPLLTPTRRILGLDGQAKMSKSMNNTIGLLDDSDTTWAKLRPAVTDPQRVRKSDPGRPEVCNVYTLHTAFSDAATQDDVAAKCRSAAWGCMDCKKVLHEAMERELVPIRTRAQQLRDEPARLDDALADGARQARAVARETIAHVKEAMGLASAG